MLDTGGADPLPLRVDQSEVTGAVSAVEADVREGLEFAIANVRRVAEGSLSPEDRIINFDSHVVAVREVPVQRAAVYVPGGRASYPSTVVMGVVAAKAAGVPDVVVCSPPGRDGQLDRAVVAAAENAEAALALVEALAPEHLQLIGLDVESFAPRVARAGCVFVGATSGPAFGDYVAGSNHILPTNGSARFASALSPADFRRRYYEVRVSAPEPLTRAAAPVARTDGFEIHARSMEARLGTETPRPDPAAEHP